MSIRRLSTFIFAKIPFIKHTLPQAQRSTKHSNISKPKPYIIQRVSYKCSPSPNGIQTFEYKLTQAQIPSDTLLKILINLIIQLNVIKNINCIEII